MERTFGFLTDSFKAYYAKRGLPPPVGFQQREFGFMYHGETFFRRHLGYVSPDHLKADILRKPPAHVYHSTAYYEHPSAHTMIEKGWQGADLIFDLDADHLEDAAGQAVRHDRRRGARPLARAASARGSAGLGGLAGAAR